MRKIKIDISEIVEIGGERWNVLSINLKKRELVVFRNTIEKVDGKTYYDVEDKVVNIDMCDVYITEDTLLPVHYK